MESLEVSGEDVLVTGCGPIGLLAIAVAKALGATRVIGADIDQARLSLAKRMGANVVMDTQQQGLKEFIMSLTNTDGIGRICECSGASVIVSSICSMLRKGGRIVMVGLPKEPLRIENVLQDVVFKSLTLKTVHGRRIFQSVKNWFRRGEVDVNALVTHEFPLSQFEKAYRTLLSGKGCKIIIDPQN